MVAIMYAYVYMCINVCMSHMTSLEACFIIIPVKYSLLVFRADAYVFAYGRMFLHFFEADYACSCLSVTGLLAVRYCSVLTSPYQYVYIMYVSE